ncbi:metalloregulator ArsR/SmtB family transcription factor [Halomonas sp. MCCC 1A17488]|uniref:Metalloregulator ArsR/SmtB family transcription factor n=1 Tax=Billgrantia sulfidoxydans TaxID=2733484 RepID=A0ABX7WAN7_9GAMM|nr:MULTISPECIES: metalloregulator ArsR/SmtB family transcription factor [Halomonas]MCE8018003.1 metalloregulator ArsR/SmtB family transcription factor [Halomonas sp. MCCC 1A17488]MCG3241336.1 metalloregulator ArsR/SmtB family transcription factor [Halomonas sp. MCCC 1A17488]QPP48700.1 ArsR family transcriptional regulator [Halomonas sp. SS10-MC5]QTP56039.1 metalloregulator ArsR/SmtB family transcription factor [Halomonas sulfidoxydans]
MTSQQDLLDTLAQVARALGNGHRLALLERLAQGDAAVETLANTTDLTIGNASQHLQHLRRAGLVTAQRSGKQMIYRLTDERIVNLLGLLRQVAETNLAEMERLVSRLFAEDDADGALEAVGRDELLAGLASGEVTLLDVRPEEEYEAGHLPEAINIPLEQLEDMLGKLPKDREFVAYCRGPYCALSHEAVQRLRQLGYRVRRFEEGYPEWKAAGLPIA